MTGVGKQQRIAEDEVRHVSSPSGGHIIVAQQIQSLLELAGKWFERMIWIRKISDAKKKVPKDIAIGELFYLSFKPLSLSLSPFSTSVRSESTPVSITSTPLMMFLLE